MLHDFLEGITLLRRMNCKCGWISLNEPCSFLCCKRRWILNTALTIGSSSTCSFVMTDKRSAANQEQIHKLTVTHFSFAFRIFWISEHIWTQVDTFLRTLSKMAQWIQLHFTFKQLASEMLSPQPMQNILYHLYLNIYRLKEAGQKKYLYHNVFLTTSFPNPSPNLFLHAQIIFF